MIYDDLLKKRAQNDNTVFQETMTDAVRVMTSGKKEDQIYRGALLSATERVLGSFGIKGGAVPDFIDGTEEILDYRMRRIGVYYRRVKLNKDWKRDASMVMIGFRKKQKDAVALIPMFFGGYQIHIYKPGGIDVPVSTGVELDEDAYVFYRPLPQRPMTPIDMLKFTLREIPVADWFLLAFAFLSIPVVWDSCSLLWQRMVAYYDIATTLSSMLINVALFVGTFAAFLFGLYVALMRSRIVERASYSLKMAFMGRILSSPADFFKDNESGRIASWLFEVDALCRSAFSGVFLTALNFIAGAEYIRFLSYHRNKFLFGLVLVYLLYLGFFVISVILRRQRAWPLAESSSDEYSFSHEMLRGINKIKLRGVQKRVYSKWGEKFLGKASLKYELPFFLRIGSLPFVVVSVCFMCYMFYYADKIDMSHANFVAFFMLYSLFSAIFMTLPKAAMDMANAGAVLKLIRPLMEVQVESGEQKGILSKITGRISLRRVDYRYNEREHMVIDNLSLDITPGEYVAITGPSGCGKSTFFRLLLGYIRPISGGVFYDGIDVITLDMQYVRKQIGCVLQDSALFDGDIFSNLTVGAPGMTMEEAWEVAEIAGIADDIRQMPMGMHTMITGGGDCISGGQRQRLMIARAIASKPKLLLFDEATSALDNITQKKVSDALDAIKCTRIVIAHRLSTIKNCDRILVMDDGRIAEEGTYDELMAKNGLFAELVKLQRT